MKEFWNVIQMVFTAVGGWLGYFLSISDVFFIHKLSGQFSQLQSICHPIDFYMDFFFYTGEQYPIFFKKSITVKTKIRIFQPYYPCLLYTSRCV